MRGLAQRHIAHYLKREPFKSCDFGGMVRQQLYTTEAKVMKYLRSDSVIAVHAVTSLQAGFTLAHSFLLHYRVSAQLIYQVQTVLALAQIKNHPATGSGDFFKSSMQLETGIIDQRPKHVAGNVLCMHANQNRILSFYVAHHHRQMHVSINDVFVSNRAKASINCRQVSFNGAFNQRLFIDAISDQVSDSDHFHVVEPCKL